MIQQICAPISVIFSFNHYTRAIKPEKIIWDSKTYFISKVGFHHSFRQGSTRFHIFSVVSNNLFFRLSLNTDTLFWNLEEISDGLPD